MTFVIVSACKFKSNRQAEFQTICLPSFPFPPVKLYFLFKKNYLCAAYNKKIAIIAQSFCKCAIIITHHLQADMKTKLSRTKNKIISVAKSLFAEMSVYKATMNDIANAAKMSRRTLYMHFKSKEEIYQYVVEDHVNSINEKLQKAADSALPPDRKLKLYILARFNVIDNLVRQNKYIRYDFIFNSLRVEQLRKGIDIKERQLLEQIIRYGKNKGIFNINDPESFDQTLLIMFKSLEQPFIIIGHRKRNYQSLREYVDLLFNGILNKS